MTIPDDYHPEARLDEAHDVTDEILSLAVECARNAVDVNWETVYRNLETEYGFFVTEMGNQADQKIRKHVRAELQRWSDERATSDHSPSRNN
jgi:hypothetical protein